MTTFSPLLKVARVTVSSVLFWPLASDIPGVNPKMTTAIPIHMKFKIIIFQKLFDFRVINLIIIFSFLTISSFKKVNGPASGSFYRASTELQRSGSESIKVSTTLPFYSFAE
jgi:hypothetical protein